MISGVLIDLGDTLIEQQVDDKVPLSLMTLVPFPDTLPFLSSLRELGLKTAIISNTEQSTKEHISDALDKIDLLEYFDEIITSTDIGEKKPKPKIFISAIEKLNLLANNVVMIGNDIKEDIGGASSLGITTIFLMRKHEKYIDQYQPTFIVKSLGEIPPLIKAYFSKENTKYTINTNNQSDNFFELARESQTELNCEAAVRFHVKSANQCLKKDQNDLAARHFMYAARFREQGEDWREIGELWQMTAHALESIENFSKFKKSYDDWDFSTHFFGGIDPNTWEKLPTEEKIGRAYRYAGYHLEKGGFNQSSYEQYFKAGENFEKIPDWEQATRTYFLSNLFFVQKFGELKTQFFNKFESANKQYKTKNEKEFLSRSLLYYRKLAAELQRQGNEEDLEMIYIKHKDIKRSLSRQDRKIGSWILLTLWRISSNYGTSFLRWLICSLIILGVVFPLLFIIFSTSNALSWIDSIALSFNTFFNLSIFDIKPTGIVKIISVSETLVSLFMLGVLVSLILNKVLR